MEPSCPGSPISAVLTVMQVKKPENLYFTRKATGYALIVVVTISPAELTVTDVERRDNWRLQLRSDPDLKFFISVLNFNLYF